MMGVNNGPVTQKQFELWTWGMRNAAEQGVTFVLDAQKMADGVARDALKSNYHKKDYKKISEDTL